MKYFNEHKLLPGDILHVRTTTPYGWAIRKCLGSKGNHDAILVNGYKGNWWVVEAVPNKGVTFTNLKKYEEKIENGAKVSVYRVPNTTNNEKWKAQSIAGDNIKSGKGYDWGAVFGILLRTNRWGNEWKWYCTELVRDAWKYAGHDVWKKDLPTPYTTEKRVKEGKLLDVTMEVLTEAGRKFAL